MKQGARRNEERDQIILDLWEAGGTTTPIARELQALGYTKVTPKVVNGVVFRAGKQRGSTTAQASRDQASKTSARAARERGRENAIKTGKLVEVRTFADPDEPAYIGPIGDFPPAGGCQYTSKHITPEFQMCGHPVKEGTRWCPWHIEHRISSQNTHTKLRPFAQKQDRAPSDESPAMEFKQAS